VRLAAERHRVIPTARDSFFALRWSVLFPAAGPSRRNELTRRSARGAAPVIFDGLYPRRWHCHQWRRSIRRAPGGRLGRCRRRSLRGLTAGLAGQGRARPVVNRNVEASSRGLFVRKPCSTSGITFGCTRRTGPARACPVFPRSGCIVTPRGAGEPNRWQFSSAIQINSSSMRLRAVLFDLDGTLLNRRETFRRHIELQVARRVELFAPAGASTSIA
jgi:hypothetical protein